ncbi:MAG: hypothetical protein FJ170_01420 [Gammaproteobacteria bacterium]|nr:hypothetical protein [Gammaproteobacteria bacterium]
MLLTLSSDNPHPVVGAGLFCKLELPVRFRKQRLAGLVDALNRFEWNAIDGPPLLGAWASHISTGRVAYVSFLPNYLWGQNCTPAFTNWLYQRAQIVREALINGRL